MKKVLMTTLVLALAATVAVGLPQDAGKSEVEKPVKKKIADFGKKMAEMPIKKSMDKKDDSGFAPGKVKWHASFDKAVAAAKKSGKPVLLFQLLGNLNEEFC